jgi:frataxin-like iron-binding protein CyaY
MAKKLWRALARAPFALALGFAAFGCATASAPALPPAQEPGALAAAEADPALDGIWLHSEIEYFEYMFAGGSWEMRFAGVPRQRGTYTAAAGLIVMTPTCARGEDGIWRDRDEHRAFLSDFMGASASVEEIDAHIDETFMMMSGTYLIGNGVLIIEFDDGLTMALVRQAPAQ